MLSNDKAQQARKISQAAIQRRLGMGTNNNTGNFIPRDQPFNTSNFPSKRPSKANPFIPGKKKGGKFYQPPTGPTSTGQMTR